VLTRDIAIEIPSVRPFVRHVPKLYQNGLIYHIFQHGSPLVPVFPVINIPLRNSNGLTPIRGVEYMWGI